MGKPDRHIRALIFIFLPILLLFMVAVSGCIQNRTDGIRVNYSIDINVVDDNGSNIDYQTDIFDIDSVLSNTSSLYSKGFGAGITVNGSSHGDGSVWPVYPEDYMVFGASMNNSSLQYDWDKRQFNPGSAGYWTIYTFEDIKNNSNSARGANLNVTIYVSSKTGKMIKK